MCETRRNLCPATALCRSPGSNRCINQGRPTVRYFTWVAAKRQARLLKGIASPHSVGHTQARADDPVRSYNVCKFRKCCQCLCEFRN